MALLRQREEKPKQQRTVNNQNTEGNLTILITISSIKLVPLLLSSTFVIRLHISGRYVTKSEDSLQQVVVLIGERLSQLAKAHLTHTYHTVVRFWELDNIDYLVLRYLNTGAQPFEEWAEEWLHDGEV
jgi:hypothetical protein